MGWNVAVQAHSAPLHLAISEPANIAFFLVLQEQLAGTSSHFSCLWAKSSKLGQLGTFIVFVQKQWVGLIRHPRPQLELLLPGSHLPGKCPNCTVQEALELYGCCQETSITSYGLWPGWKFADA